ncbi:MAG: hypothetical protein PUP93_28490 [Rhizonema sp. NSF051]|nr:hypothetical protein [Rhizonema sp. NSF051]
MAFDLTFVQKLWASSQQLFYLLEGFTQARVLALRDLNLDEFLTG